MLGNLRVHISPVGFEFRRITEPLIRMHADKVYLITSSPNDTARKFFNQIKAELSQNYKTIQIVDVFVDLWNLYDCLDKFRTIVLSERNSGNHVYVNVSTSTKIISIAGMLSCMLWGAHPYYVPVSYPSFKEEGIPPTEFVQDADFLPVYDIKQPKPEIMLTLGLIKANQGKIRKALLIKKLESKGIIRVKDENKSSLTEAAKHSQLRAILDPLENEWKYVRIDSSGRRSEVVITEQGETALKVFGVQSPVGEKRFII